MMMLQGWWCMTEKRMVDVVKRIKVGNVKNAKGIDYWMKEGWSLLGW
jgi:hypothetical protein